MAAGKKLSPSMLSKRIPLAWVSVVDDSSERSGSRPPGREPAVGNGHHGIASPVRGVRSNGRAARSYAPTGLLVIRRWLPTASAVGYCLAPLPGLSLHSPDRLSEACL